MSMLIGQGSKPAVPCALHRYCSHGHTAQSLTSLSHGECQREFQYWVTSTRATSSATSLDISPKEHLMCPLLWCRASFKDLASVLHHVSTCPWLSDAWYWCPSCCRPERFTTAETTSTTAPQPVDLDKEKMYKRAVNFFKNLARRRDGHSASSSSSAVSTSVEYSNNQICELADTPYDPTRSVELDSGNIHELEDEAECVTPGSSMASYTQYELSTRSPNSWEDETLSAPPPYSPPIAVSGSPVAGIGAQSGTSRGSLGIHQLSNHAVTSPVSLARDSPVLHEEIAGGYPLDLWQLNYPRISLPPSQSPPQLPGTYQLRSSPPSMHEAEESSYIQEPATTKVQIEDLHEAVRALSEEPIRNLATSIDTTPPCLEPYARALVKIGFRALRNYFRGTIPSSFQDVFALTHVAIASSYIVRKDDHAYSWNALLEEACQWQDLLPDPIERRTFVKVMSYLCHPQGSTASSSLTGVAIDDVLTPTEHATLVHLIHHISSPDVDAVIQEKADERRQRCTATNEPRRLHVISQSHMMISGCKDFLDTFGHAVMVEDLANRQTDSSWYIEQHVPGIKTLDSNIIRPLQKRKGLEAFRGVVTEAQNMLRRGLLRSARDVEVVLLRSGKSHSKSPQLLRRYLNVVKYLCDNVMKEWGLHWRDHFYEVILGTVLASSAELSLCRDRSFQIPSVTPPGNIGLSYIAGTPTARATMPPAELEASTSFPPYSVQASSVPSDDVSYCLYASCRARFTGSYRRNNLARHLDTVSHHNQDAPALICELCQKTFGQRSDNLRQHLRNKH